MRGLVLTGGKSRRMGSPKAEIAYSGEPEYLRCVRLLGSVCEEVFLSTSPFWSPPKLESSFQLLPDLASSDGPMSGMAAAFQKHSDSAWFVLACDLPFFDDEAVQALLNQREPQMDATCFIGYQEKPEPLCAIYEPSAASMIESGAREHRCPRKAMELMRTKRVFPSKADWVRNINERSERNVLMNLESVATSKWIEVKYVAQLREAAGMSLEKFQTFRPTPRLVYEDLAQQHGFLLSPKYMRVAINDVIVDWDSQIHEHDRLMFVPPVAGG